MPDVKQVFTPALVRARLSLYEVPPGMNGMHANGLCSISVGLSSLKGRTSNKFSGMDSSLLFCLLYWLCLLRSLFLGWGVVGGL